VHDAHDAHDAHDDPPSAPAEEPYSALERGDLECLDPPDVLQRASGVPLGNEPGPQPPQPEDLTEQVGIEGDAEGEVAPSIAPDAAADEAPGDTHEASAEAALLSGLGDDTAPPAAADAPAEQGVVQRSDTEPLGGPDDGGVDLATIEEAPTPESEVVPPREAAEAERELDGSALDIASATPSTLPAVMPSEAPPETPTEELTAQARAEPAPDQPAAFDAQSVTSPPSTSPPSDAAAAREAPDEAPGAESRVAADADAWNAAPPDSPPDASLDIGLDTQPEALPSGAPEGPDDALQDEAEEAYPESAPSQEPYEEPDVWPPAAQADESDAAIQEPAAVAEWSPTEAVPDAPSVPVAAADIASVPWTPSQTVLGVVLTLGPWLVIAFGLQLLQYRVQNPTRPQKLPPGVDLAKGVEIFVVSSLLEAAFLIAPLYFAYRAQPAWLTRRKRLSGGARALGLRGTSLGGAVLALVLAQAVIYGASIAYDSLITALRLPVQTNADALLQQAKYAPYTVICTLLVAVLIAPFCEEVFFRGFVFPGLARGMGIWPAVVLSALLFGAAHADIGSFVVLTVIGVVLAVVRWQTRSLWPCVAIHTLNNTIALVGILVLLRH
jgi:membrane protease YdiL (CAAX protease family)